jgi:LmbE family N-acetylglucosaminyl deacetylase
MLEEHTDMSSLSLMCVFAHPDDETLAIGGLLAKYAAEGVTTHAVIATRGERGWQGDPEANPGLQALGQIREAELRAAANTLGVHKLTMLDYLDGDLDRADPARIIPEIVACLREARPQVVITFGPDGSYGHPDHIAISQFTLAAVMLAGDPGYSPNGVAYGPHRVSKLYYYVENAVQSGMYSAQLGGDFTFAVDGVERRTVVWPDWEITTRIDASDHWRTVQSAIACHHTQTAAWKLDELPEAWHRTVWRHSTLYRVFSLANGGRIVETDVFEGLR